MFTKVTRPGKFEGNESQLIAEVVYEASLDGVQEEWGDVLQDGYYYALVEGRRYSFIVKEDSYGFVQVFIFDIRNNSAALEARLLDLDLWDGRCLT